ncbi:ABC transporter permease [Paeniglutamicibacter sp. ZC-3]|uniref:ABC transporter permease n=1 Tax=Paeniglutamicibacter sp. ZC-3 TaxID=2986919 RepID=UPI0021F74528|nr:ABC transporter permease [Paeniglutamicibacter sp. ZC-3]MCV9993337.1 ABC transporter permease [Paeniglutamicibacter sp. ZC-3]
MLKLVIHRLLISIPVLVVVSVITFVLQSFLPGDQAQARLGVHATPDQLDALRSELNLDEPLPVQYWLYMSKLVQGDMGNSVFTGVSVSDSIADRLPVTLSLLVGATLVAALAGVVLGIFSSIGPRFLRRLVDVVSLVGAALPNFWVALVLVAIFAISLNLVPATGYVRPTESVGGWISTLALPVVALSLTGIASIAKVTRDNMMNNLSKDFIRTLRAGGIPEKSLVFRHALKNSGMSVSTITGITFINTLSATVVIESVFGLPGLGSLIVAATNQADIVVVQGIVLVYTLIAVAVNLLVDLTYGLFNPKAMNP